MEDVNYTKDDSNTNGKTAKNKKKRKIVLLEMMKHVLGSIVPIIMVREISS